MLKRLLFFAIFSLLVVPPAHAIYVDLDGTITADNHYDLYLSTDPGLLGSSLGYSSDQSMTWSRPYDWETAETFSVGSLTSQVDNYLQVVAWDQGVVSGLLANLYLNNNAFRFGNNQMTLDTNAISGWTARTIEGYDITNHSGGVIGTDLLDIYAEGVNGSGAWAHIGHPVYGINSDTQWIWTSVNGAGDVGSDASPMLRLFTAKISPVTPPVPEPISSTLFLLGAGAFGLKLYRRKKA